MNMKAMIAVKGHSERVPDKNIRPFADSNLLELKIEQLKRIFRDKDIIVNSESDELLNIAESHGVEAVKREPYYARGDVCMSDVYSHMASNADCDTIAYTNVTNPLIQDSTIRTAVAQFKNCYGIYDSLASCHRVVEYLWQNGKPVNYNPERHPNSQDLPKLYGLNFAVSIIPRELMVSKGSIVGGKPYLFEIDEMEGLDIDTPLDFFVAEQIYEKYGFD